MTRRRCKVPKPRKTPRWRQRTCRNCAEPYWGKGEAWHCGECLALLIAVAIGLARRRW
jgi:hypothetical protein